VYGKVISYEEPVLVWRGELEGALGRDESQKWGLYPKEQAFTMPLATEGQTDLSQVLDKVLNAFHEQTSSTRFQILKSAWGYHLVPRQAHDANGVLVPTTSLLDASVTVAIQERTPEEHILALADAIKHATGVAMDVSAIPGTRRGFDMVFRATPARFEWGVLGVVGRNALIGLLQRSATTFSWRLNCQSSAQQVDRLCVLNLERLVVAATDQDGRQEKRVVDFDRCGNCPPLQRAR